MQYFEVKELPLKELHRLLAEQRQKLRDLRFKTANGQLKSTHEVNVTKQFIARLLTRMNELRNQEATATDETNQS